MIVIDGAYHEGGGQIVRTAAALSSLFKKDVRVENIRAKRPVPGLSFQHVCAINAVAELCNAQTRGVSVGSSMIEFLPGTECRKDITVRIPTAGSIGLVLETLVVAASGLKEKIKVDIEGGATFGKWAPPLPYVRNVFACAIEKFGYNVRVDVMRHGFYPQGGGAVSAEISSGKKKRASFEKFHEKPDIYGLTVASRSLEAKDVASRQGTSARKVLERNGLFGKISIETVYDETPSTGSGIVLWCGGGMFIGASAIGERGKTAESVGEDAAEELISEYKKRACADRHLCDQLIPFLAICGGAVKTSEITKHTETNMWVVEKFTDVKFDVNREEKIICV